MVAGEGVARDPGIHQPGRGGGLALRSARGLITFALGFIPVYSNLSRVAMGTQRAGEGSLGGESGGASRRRSEGH